MNDNVAFQAMCAAAAQAGEHFSTEYWAQRFIDLSASVFAGTPPSVDPVWRSAPAPNKAAHRRRSAR
jgi:hypothetical protein